MVDDDRDLLDEFVLEVRGHLARLESDLRQIEQDQRNAELLGNLYRMFHNIRGAASFFRLKSVKDLSEAMEGVTIKLREHRLILTPEMVTAYLAARDVLLRMVADLERSDQVPYGPEKERLALLAAMSASPVELTAGAPATSVAGV